MLALGLSSFAFAPPTTSMAPAVSRARMLSAMPTVSHVRMAENDNAKSSVPRTVQEGKDDFQVMWGKGQVSGWGEGTAPLPMSTQAFCNEMITTVTIAMASPNYQYAPPFGLGFETLCSYYAVELRVESERGRMSEALAGALLADAAQMKKDAESLLAAADGVTEEALFETPEFKALAALNGEFKYTYVFGVGLLVLMQKVGVDPNAGVKSWTEKLNLKCENQFTRDANYFKVQMEKLELMKGMLTQMKTAGEKASAKQAADKAAGIESKDPRKAGNLAQPKSEESKSEESKSE